MIRIVHLPANIDPMTLAFIRHRTWITVNKRQYESKLLNQYDLAEVIEGAHEPMTPDQRRHAYRRWLWDQMQQEHGVVWRELSELADAHAAGDDITITVHADTVHADIIQHAIEWMAANTEPVHLPKRPHTVESIPFGYTGPDAPDERWPIADPEEENTIQTAFDPSRVRWIVGHQHILLGYLYDTEAVQTALVVDHGLVKLGRRPTSLRPFIGKLDPHWVAAISTMLLELEPDAVPLRLDIHSGDTTHDDIRYAPWRPDALVPDDTHITPFNHTQVIGRSLPEVVWRSRKRPYFLRRALGENVRPILRWNAMNGTAPRILEPAQQADGHFNTWRPATRADWQQLHVA